MRMCVCVSDDEGVLVKVRVLSPKIALMESISSVRADGMDEDDAWSIICGYESQGIGCASLTGRERYRAREKFWCLVMIMRESGDDLVVFSRWIFTQKYHMENWSYRSRHTCRFRGLSYEEPFTNAELLTETTIRNAISLSLIHI